MGDKKIFFGRVKGQVKYVVLPVTVSFITKKTSGQFFFLKNELCIAIR